MAMTRRTILSLVAVVAFIMPAKSAPDPASYRFHTMPETDYYGGIHSIAKDTVGRMWFSGADGVYMYNGGGFSPVTEKIISLSPKSFWSFGQVVCTSKGEIYIASNQGLVSFDYAKEAFSFVLEGNAGTISAASDGTIWMIRNSRVEALGPDWRQLGGGKFPDKEL